MGGTAVVSLLMSFQLDPCLLPHYVSRISCLPLTGSSLCRNSNEVSSSSSLSWFPGVICLPRLAVSLVGSSSIRSSRVVASLGLAVS